MSWTDPVARLQDQEGLEVNSAGFTKSPFIWFRDGTVVIVCTDCEVIKMGFRVNQSILSLNSSVFKDMFCVVQPDQVNAGEVFEGCPIVYLPDDPFAMNHLLRMLYERSYGRNLHDFNLAEIEGILHLATKYMIYHVRIEIFDHLQKLFPSTIQGYRSNRLHTPHQECFRGLKIAVQFDLPSLIPCAIYLCSLHEVQYIFGEMRRLGLQSDIQEVLSFKEALTAHVTRDVLSSDWFPIERTCLNAMPSTGCSGIDPSTARRILVAYLDSTIDVFAADPTESLSGKTEFRCCATCLRERERVEEEAYKPMLWNLLPVFTKDDRDWTGWNQVEQAHRDAVKTWTNLPPGGPGDGYY